jgi:hypothetical protein
VVQWYLIVQSSIGERDSEREKIIPRRSQLRVARTLRPALPTRSDSCEFLRVPCRTRGTAEWLSRGSRARARARRAGADLELTISIIGDRSWLAASRWDDDGIALAITTRVRIRFRTLEARQVTRQVTLIGRSRVVAGKPLGLPSIYEIPKSATVATVSAA